MKKVLIPTDFSVDSLQLVEYAVLNNPKSKLHIIFVAGFRLPDTRWGLTHFSQSEEVHKQCTDDFITAKRSLMLEHKKSIETISFELFTGENSFAFQNFLKQLNAADTIIPKEKSLYSRNKKWFDTTEFLRKNVRNVTEVPVGRAVEIPQLKFSLINLFNL
ncbi:MAG: hypothetical protein KDC34_02855 [Saprospiraceae bacterium]|nr:hypothetical protein [Saprospiraceae bacterium]